MSDTTLATKGASSQMNLKGRALFFARLFWIIIVLISMGVFLFSLPAGYEGVLRYVKSSDVAQSLHGHKINPNLLVQIRMFRAIGFWVIHLLVGVMIFYYRSYERAALWISLALITFGTTSFVGLVPSLTALHLPARLMVLLGAVSIGLLFFLFPDGHFIPAWTRYILIAWAILLFWIILFAEHSSVFTPKANDILTAGFIVIFLLAQVIRYNLRSDITQRQQTKWVMFGASVAVVGWIATTFGFNLLPQNIVIFEIKRTLQLGIFLLIPLSITLAMFRYRLWNIDPIVNRTLVYGMLSFLTIAFYVLIVGNFAIYFRSIETNIVISFIATGVVAILFEPLRQRLQRTVNNIMYGERDDPATVLTRLGQRLESALAPDSVLQTIVETIAQTLRLPYAAISLLDNAQATIFASTPNLPPSELIHLPLAYQSERVGELILAVRSKGESFSPADMNLINIIAQQAGVAAYTVRLNNDLRSSRERLVTAREEERRRLRRDLHDGVGPILASLLQRLDAVRILIARDPEKAADMAEELKGQVKTTIADIRRLVYALRPPVLDELGLVSAIREFTTDYQGASGLQVTVTAPEILPHLPAAVEVAAYRIIMEAFANVVRYAQATICQITIKIEGQKSDSTFCIEINDNGKGLPEKHHAGVGIISMRERTAELGGTICIESEIGIGTQIRAWLPISEE